jgi:N-acetylglucosamine kinase-like BadF-type ATPase
VTAHAVIATKTVTVKPVPIKPVSHKDKLFLGIDAGGTKTVALLTDGSGVVIGVGRSGASNIYSSVRSAFEALDQVVAAALTTAGVDLQQITATCLSATGADWLEDFELLERGLLERGHRCVHVVNDAMGALRAGSMYGTGVVVVCGTAAGIGAKSALGLEWHSSFWQEPEGAEQLGNLALRAVYRSELKLDPATSLSARLLEYHGLNDVEALLHAYTARDERPKRNVGHLARILLDEAAAGDATARRITLDHGTALGDYAITAARKVGLLADPCAEFALVTAGGVMRHPSRLMAQALLARMHQVAPRARLVQCPLEPVAGAVMLALEHSGAVVTETVWDKLGASLPGETLFQT